MVGGGKGGGDCSPLLTRYCMFNRQVDSQTFRQTYKGNTDTQSLLLRVSTSSGGVRSFSSHPVSGVTSSPPRESPRCVGITSEMRSGVLRKGVSNGNIVWFSSRATPWFTENYNSSISILPYCHQRLYRPVALRGMGGFPNGLFPCRLWLNWCFPIGLFPFRL